MAQPPDNSCQWVSLAHALETFALYTGQTQSQAHIKPLHWYVACRLVIEGGFHPDEITPHPPFRVVNRQGGLQLEFDPSVALGGEATVLGGLKTKNVDVVVTKKGLGPVLAVSCKGVIGAFRNLTNRMEEAVGDCTNLHITYPAMVTGYLMIMRAHREDALIAAVATEPAASPPEGRAIGKNDIAIQMSGEPVESVVRFHNALRELTGRRGIRDDVSRYEAASLVLVDPASAPRDVLVSYPAPESPLRVERFFETLYLRYDERYVYSAPDLKSVTRRLEWSEDSPILRAGTAPTTAHGLDYEPRLSGQGAADFETD